LQEAVLLARTAPDDATIRARLLDYLQEGLGAEQLERLMEQEEVELQTWYNLFEKVHTPIDAGELRGLSIRSLEAFPDHPGLLLLRGVSEGLCSDANDAVSAQAIYASLRAAIVNYDIGSDAVLQTASALFDLAAGKAPSLRVPLTYSLLRLADEDVVPAEFRSFVCSQVARSGDQTTQAVIATFGLARTCRALGELANRVIERWSPAAVRALNGEMA
jgi:hypothetical protein